MARLQPVATLTFSSRSYDPISHLHAWDYTEIADVKLAQAATSRLPQFAGDCMDDLAAYIAEQELTLVGTPISKSSRSAGRWANSTTIILARKG